MPSQKSSKQLERPRQLALHWNVRGLVAGVDEAGRGPLAGPVVAAAVILDELAPIRGLADSKTLSPRRRDDLYDLIRARALCFSIASASVEEIDAINILQATMLAMKRAIEGLRLLPHSVVVDGNRVPVVRVPVSALVGGDAKMAAISAASILAKVHRDRGCQALHAEYPHYGFGAHKGYPTPEHLAALLRHGPCAVHRRSFAPVRDCVVGPRAQQSIQPAQPVQPTVDMRPLQLLQPTMELRLTRAPEAHQATPLHDASSQPCP